MPAPPFRVFGIAARPSLLPPKTVLFWNRVPVQSFTPAKVLPLLVGQSRFAVGRCPGCAVFLSRAAADDVWGYRLRPLFELHVPLESYPATPTRPPQRSGPLMGFRSLQHLKDPRSTSRRLACPLRSACRVWLPSWRLTPSNPLPVLFHTGSAPGISPSEGSPPGRLPRSFDQEEPTYR